MTFAAVLCECTSTGAHGCLPERFQMDAQGKCGRGPTAGRMPDGTAARRPRLSSRVGRIQLVVAGSWFTAGARLFSGRRGFVRRGGGTAALGLLDAQLCGALAIFIDQVLDLGALDAREGLRTRHVTEGALMLVAVENLRIDLVQVVVALGAGIVSGLALRELLLQLAALGL